MRRTTAFTVGSLLCLMLVGCAGSPSFLEPASSVSQHQADLFTILIYLSIAVFVIVEGLLLINILRFRKKDGDGETAPQIYGNTRLEVIWTGIPLLLVVVLFVLTVNTVQAVSAPSGKADDVNVHVIGHRWWWEFDYPDLGILTANELHVPVGATIQMDLDSVDVIHSFWVSQLSGKEDVIPGQTNHLWFRADKVGSYYGQCAEFCGLNHANMRIRVIVESQEDFDAWVANQQLPPAEPQSDLAQQGHDLITNGICSNCHTLGDNEGLQSIGPNLTHLFSRSVFAGATYDLTEDNIRRWLSDNPHMKPGNDMAGVTLDQNEIDALMAYLPTLK